MKRTPLIAAIVVLVVASSAVIATAHDRAGEGSRGPDRAGMMFERFDLNADGQVTRDEIAAAAAQHFAEADTNGDGLLSGAELSAAAETRQTEQRQRRTERRVEQMIERHDANGDGSLSLEEMAASERGDHVAHMFERFDADEDGAITKAELDEMKGKRGPGRWFGRHGHGRN